MAAMGKKIQDELICKQWINGPGKSQLIYIECLQKVIVYLQQN